MCGIFGAIIIKPTERDFDRIESLFLNLKSRGTHATGCAWVKNGKIHIEKETVPAEIFVDCILRLDQMVNEDGNLYMLGHTRWTTSNIFDHQPIGDDRHAIAHNGIVTNEPKERWKELFGLDTVSENDSELIYSQLHSNPSVHPLERFEKATLGVVELTARKSIYGYRNYGRPLAISYNPRKYAVFASTYEALIDSEFGHEPDTETFDCKSYTEYFFAAESRNVPDTDVWERSIIRKHVTSYTPLLPDLSLEELGDK